MKLLEKLFHRGFVLDFMAAEVSRLTRYMDCCYQVYSRDEEDFELLKRIDCPRKAHFSAANELPDHSADAASNSAPIMGVLLNGSFNHSLDIQSLLSEISPRLGRSDRVLAMLYNPYLRGVYSLANRLGLRKGPLPSTFLTRAALQEIATLSGFDIVRTRTSGYCPWRLLGIGTLINALLPSIPLLRWLAFSYLVVLRPRRRAVEGSKPSLSIIIPARNEKGNIENALKRLPPLGRDIEIVFVEGHSSDDTWTEIERVQKLYGDRFNIQAFRQTGKGKNDAVRLGFSKAKGELLTILDADLTMPPERLQLFLDAYDNGLADFVNGSRLVYPMEGEAMRFLNHLGNVFFAKALSWVLETPLSDSLCGTKLVSRRDYGRITQWRKDFGDFDPFGDFELLFPAASLALGVITVPVHYRARTYGSTQISRFRHGAILLVMTLIGFFRIRLGATRV